MPLALACPSCRLPLAIREEDERRCEPCGAVYRRTAGVWGFLTEERRASVEELARRYETVRRSEGRAVGSARQLLALPFRDLSKKHPYEWFIRSRSYRALLRHVLRPAERRSRAPLAILDLGSGVGWLAHRLARRGHEVAAVDVVTGDVGLGALVLLPSTFVVTLAEFDRLPFADNSVDLVVYNAAFHYAARYAETLREALRVLRAGGRVVVMDSPLYRDPASGAAMVRERDAAFGREHGFHDAAASEGFLTYDALATLEQTLGLEWVFHQPWYGVAWWAKPVLARLRGRREPAQFKLLVGQRREGR
jgi:SAM-dependent methyltransferase